MPITQGDADEGDGIVTDDLNRDVPEHERSKTKTLIVEFPAL